MNFKLISIAVTIALMIPVTGFSSDIGLCKAAENGKSEAVEALIDVGANVNFRCDQKNNLTPLIKAVFARSVPSVAILLGAGADPNLQDGFKYTALHYAAMKDKIEIVESLLKAGADPEIKNNKGETALDIAGAVGYADYVRLIGSYQSKSTGKSKAKAPANISEADVLILKNGDILSGNVLTAEFQIDASYAALKFKFSEIDAIVYEGDKQNIESIVLKNGDKISGKVGPDIIRLKLQSGQQIDVDKDKVKQIKAKR